MKHQVSAKEIYKKYQKSKENQQNFKMEKLNRGKEKITTVVNYVKKETNIYCLLLYPKQAEVALNCSKVQHSVVTSRKHF